MWHNVRARGARRERGLEAAAPPPPYREAAWAVGPDDNTAGAKDDKYRRNPPAVTATRVNRWLSAGGMT